MATSMADAEAEVEEYESDPEETKLSLKMRRRVASDDEEEEEERERESEKPPRRIESDGESDGQGAAADYEEYDDEEYVEDDEEEPDEEDVYEELGVIRGTDHVESVEVVVEGADGAKETGIEDGENNENGHGNVRAEEEKKVNEPYAVPTAGAFYMHDDRFRNNAGGVGRNRRTFGGRRLWESKDDRKWGHDKFEELSMEERHYEEGRGASRGRFRGRSRGRVSNRMRGRRPKEYNNDNNQSNNNNINQKIQNNASKGMRGRGSRRYRPSLKDNFGAPPPPNKQSGPSVEKVAPNSTARVASASASNGESDAVRAAKQGFVSSLNSASPPFYPSSSATKEITLTHKRELQTGTRSHSVQPSALGDSSAAAQSRGNKLHTSDPITTVAVKPLSTINPTQSQPLRGQGRGFNAVPHISYQSPVINNQFKRVSQPVNLPSTQRNSVHSGQPSFQVTGQQFAQQSGAGSQGSSPPKTVSESAEIESSSNSSKLKSAMVAKGKGTLQSTVRGSVPFGGGIGSGDPNFPSFLPVMQFAGQHPGGIPAVGMAFPGYVTQPQLGLGSSEMTWLPVLAGAAGALGAPYCSPFMAANGAYHARPSGQLPSLPAAPSKENNTSRPNNDSKPQQRPEISNDDLGQRQKNPRRYTEMKFGQ